MKYYKRLITVNTSFPCKKDIIYPETYQEGDFKPVSKCVQGYPEYWEEVPESEYLLQEAAIRYPKGIIFKSTHYKDLAESNGEFKWYEGNRFVSISTTKGRQVYYKENNKNALWAEIIEDKIMEKEFKLPEKWCVKVTDNSRSVLQLYVKSKKDFDSSYYPIKRWVISDTGTDNSYQN